jgi:hypothetical protein
MSKRDVGPIHDLHFATRVKQRREGGDKGIGKISISQNQFSVRAATREQILLFSDVGMFDRASNLLLKFYHY